MALRWLTQSGVSTAIPGARTVEQAQANAAVGDLPAIDDATMARSRASTTTPFASTSTLAGSAAVAG